MDTKPVLVPTLLSDLETYFGPASPETASYVKTFATRLYNFTGSPLSDQAADVLWGLRNVSARLEAIHNGLEGADAPAEELQFSDRVEVLERRVHTLWYVEDPDNEQHLLFRTFGWACVIYIYCKLRELPPELGMNAMLAGRIRAALEECSYLNVLLATFRDLMLWQMFICGRVADARDRPFFASQATKLLLIQKVEKPIDIIIASEGFLWPERQPGLPYRTKFVLHPLQRDRDEADDGESESDQNPTSQAVQPSFIRMDSDSP
jgi:hypothetical protein